MSYNECSACSGHVCWKRAVSLACVDATCCCLCETVPATCSLLSHSEWTHAAGLSLQNAEAAAAQTDVHLFIQSSVKLDSRSWRIGCCCCCRHIRWWVPPRHCWGVLLRHSADTMIDNVPYIAKSQLLQSCSPVYSKLNQHEFPANMFYGCLIFVWRKHIWWKRARPK